MLNNCIPTTYMGLNITIVHNKFVIMNKFIHTLLNKSFGTKFWDEI